jgi:hypothetical protein
LFPSKTGGHPLNNIDGLTDGDSTNSETIALQRARLAPVRRMDILTPQKGGVKGIFRRIEYKLDVE